MNRIIKLSKSDVVRIENTEPFLLPGTLTLKFNAIGYDMQNAFISIQNGTIKGHYRYKKEFVIDEKFLFSGKLNITVHLYMDEKVVKEWHVLPLKIVETEFGIQCFDFLTELEKKIESLETNTVDKESFNLVTTKLNELSEKHNELAETVIAIKENY